MALPFLPPDHIQEAFTKYVREAVMCNDERVRDFLSYVEDNYWVKGKTWGPQDWSIFMRPTRTNNDVEGWHRRLNGLTGRPHVSFYSFLLLIFEEANLLPL